MYVEVTVNGMDVGNVPASTMQSIRSSVLKDRGTWLSQAGNLLYGAWRMWCAALALIPVLAICCIAWFTHVDPEGFTALWSAAVRNPSEALLMARTALTLLGLITVFATATAAALFPGRFGFRNIFSARVAETLCKRLGCHSRGPVQWRYGEYN